MTPVLRRVWLPWLLLLVPTLLIGAVALRLLWLEQRRIDLAAGEVRQRAEAATRVKALIEAGHAFRDDSRLTDPSETVRAGARYAIDIPPPAPAEQPKS